MPSAYLLFPALAAASAATTCGRGATLSYKRRYNALRRDQTFEYLSAMANEIAIVDGEDLRKRAGALRRFL